VQGGDETSLSVAHNINLSRNEISYQDSTEKWGMQMAALVSVFYSKGKGKVVNVHTLKACRGIRSINPLIPNLSAGWK
jgi:hypothetical protein